jgi:hypothetical protein
MGEGLPWPLRFGTYTAGEALVDLDSELDSIFAASPPR